MRCFQVNISSQDHDIFVQIWTKIRSNNALAQLDEIRETELKTAFEMINTLGICDYLRVCYNLEKNPADY